MKSSTYMPHPVSGGEPKPPPSNNRGPRSNKGAVRRLRLMLFAFTCFLVWAAMTFWEQHNATLEKQAELSVLEQQLAEIELENESYKLEIERLHDPEYIEQRLRKDYMMSRDGETLFIRTR